MSERRTKCDAGERRLGALGLLAFLLPLLLGAIATPALAGDGGTPRAQPLALEDFAVGRKLEAVEPGGLQSVLLDYDVYRRSVEGRLADLRVFDADGRPAPFAIRRQLPEQRDAERIESLPVFRIDASKTHEDHALSLEDYSIEAELSETGAIVRVHREGQASAVDAPPAGWLLDATDLRRPIVGIELEFEPADRDFVDRIRIDRSSDLARWSAIDAEIAVARLSQAGHRIERTRFDLPSLRAKYLRLTPEDAARLPALRAVRVRLASRAESLPRFRHTLSGRIDPSAPEVVLFDLDAEIPVERLRVVFATPGTFVEGRLESARSAEGPWRTRHDGVFYSYERRGRMLRNSAVAWQGSRDRYVRLVTSERGGGLQGPPPTLEIEWIPEQLVYLDRTGGASTLAVGRIDTVDASFRPEQLLRTHRARDANMQPTRALLGPEEILAGDAVLVRSVPIAWRTYGLWAVLIAIVGIVVGLSLRLLRSVDAEPDAEP